MGEVGEKQWGTIYAALGSRFFRLRQGKLQPMKNWAQNCKTMKNTPNWGQDNLHVNADEETSSSTDCEEKVLTVMGIMFAHRYILNLAMGTKSTPVQINSSFWKKFYTQVQINSSPKRLQWGGSVSFWYGSGSRTGKKLDESGSKQKRIQFSCFVCLYYLCITVP